MRKYLFTGLGILLPLVITLIIAKFVISLLTVPFYGIISSFLFYYDIAPKGFLFLSREEAIILASQILSLIAFCLIVLLIGIIARYVLFHYFLGVLDNLFNKLPLINKIYQLCKDVTNSLFKKDEENFAQVVLAPFPNERTKSFGLLLREETNQNNHDYISVFVPAAPNLTVGYLVFYKKDQLIFVDMTVQEAFKSIISCGAIFNDLKIKQGRQGP
jgi:uncharacterized membrane protein